ncbi:hypothetical protein JM93_04415 [Roseibium hamelinense]|uniref:Uncharacterized protein n=1 Tax=Roseibium hamelinense TaxID=150831 RepID=A0A562SBI4_9HYPH|nr:hypothetical protein [Roseibium hamelinense]MTI42087.1 hypothetical protein [Roseibium hamelinense]TWI78697.1 hypothetical protein JM93_04415 [Roseibium hamelinense]
MSAFPGRLWEDGTGKGLLCRRNRGRGFGKLILVTVCAAILGVSQASTEATSTELTDSPADMALLRESDGQSSTLLSTFVGPDNALPLLSWLLCWGAPRKDGLPVIFSTDIDQTTMQRCDFRNITALGKTGEIRCVTLIPATDASDDRSGFSRP